MFVSDLILCLLFLSGGLVAERSRTFTVPLDAAGALTLHWQLDYPEHSLSLELHSHTSPGSWLALGFSDYGDITDADICIFWTDWRGKSHLQDTWTDGDGVVQQETQQDCRYVDHDRLHGVTRLLFSRHFDTCDEYDYVIEEGTTHLVWATGPGPLFSLEGLDLSSAQHGFQRTQLLKNLNSVVRLPADTWSLLVTEENNQVLSVDTTYWCKVIRLPEAFRKKHHIVQFEPIITPGNEPLVHHMELFHCEAPADEQLTLYRGRCDDKPLQVQVCKKVMAAWAMGATPFYYPEVQVCKKVMAAWAMGATLFYYPEDAGLPVGGPEFNMYAMLEVHYNNPDLKDDWVDSSGIKVHLTSTLRRYDAAVLELGLEYIDKMAIPPREPHFSLSGYCVSECTGVSLPLEGITIFGSQLHTHLTGLRVITRHVRDGRELLELNRDNHYSTHFQEIRLLKRPVRVLPGDALITTCWYNTTGRPNITLGGFAITDEMCVNYVYYYPKTKLEVCKSSISDQSLQTYFRQVHDWERQETSSQLGVSDNYRSIQWNPVRASILHALYDQSPVYMQCNESSGDRFPGDWTSIPVTPVLYPLPPAPRFCPTAPDKALYKEID